MSKTTPVCKECLNNSTCGLYLEDWYTYPDYLLVDVVENFVKEKFPELAEVGPNDYAKKGIRFWVGMAYCPRFIQKAQPSAAKKQGITRNIGSNQLSQADLVKLLNTLMKEV